MLQPIRPTFSTAIIAICGWLLSFPVLAAEPDPFARSVGASAPSFELEAEAELGDEISEAALTSRALTLYVNCSSGFTLDRALRRFRFVRQLDIVFRGVCTERLVIERDGVTLRGFDDTAQVRGGITIDGATRVQLSDFSITGDPDDAVGIGVEAVRGAAVQVSSLVVEDLARRGVVIESSVAELRDVTVRSSGNAGIAYLSSSGKLEGAITADDNVIGLFVSLGSSLAAANAEMSFDGNQVAAAIQLNSSIEHSSGRLVVTNSFFGLLLAGQGSYAHADEILAEDNLFFGVFVDELSNLTPLIGAPGDGPRITSRRNGIGVLVERSAQVLLAPGTVLENNDVGLQVYNSHVVASGSTITGNADVDGKFLFSSRVTFRDDPSQLGTLSCEPSVLTEGPFTCPPPASLSLAEAPVAADVPAFDRAALQRLLRAASR